MTARRRTSSLAGLGLVAAVATAGCLGVYQVTIETPIQSKVDVSAFHSVLIAGFAEGGSKAVDTNKETVRLLKSQLRTKATDLKVVDADPVDINAEVNKMRLAAGQPALPSPMFATTPASTDASGTSSAGSDAQKILQQYADALTTDPWKSYWEKLGEQYQSPLIVTGAIFLNETASSGQQKTVVPTQDATGRIEYTEKTQYVEKKGLAIDPTYIFIDSRTGTQIYKENYHQDVSYASTQNTPALSSYFELMDKIVPNVLSTMSSQKIRGTRFLMK